MKVCIIGGTGNISTSIVRLLVEVGHEVTVFNRGKTRGVPPGANAIHGDRKDRAMFEAAMQTERFDAAIDMMCHDAEDARSTLRALHQWLYVDDAAPGFVFALGRDRCLGQTNNLMKSEFGTWADYHGSHGTREPDSGLGQDGLGGSADCSTAFGWRNEVLKRMRNTTEG